jgi:hypothetical protein
MQREKLVFFITNPLCILNDKINYYIRSKKIYILIEKLLYYLQFSLFILKITKTIYKRFEF